MDPEKGPLQKLLLLEEYSDLEDIVLVEGRFVELDKCGDAVQQVVMGISPDHFFLSRRNVLNWKEDPVVTSEMDADLDVYGLELKWITPLLYIDISPTSDEYILRVSSKHARCRYFELCTIRERDNHWYKWLDRINYLKDDPYGYISQMSLRHDSTASLSSEAGLSSDYSAESLKPGSLEFDLISDTDNKQGVKKGKKSESKPLLKIKSKSSKTKSDGSKKKNIFSRFWKRCKSKENTSKGKAKV